MHAKTRIALVTAAAAATMALPLAGTAGAQEPVDSAELARAEARAESAGLPGIIIVIERGDTLSLLAGEHGLDGGWRRLFDANPQVEDPDVIVPGSQLRIPEPQEVFAPRSPAAAQTATGGKADDQGAGTAPSAPAATTAPAPSSAGSSVWDRLAACESGGNWSIDSAYDGGLQFHPDTWRGYGGTQYAAFAHQASRAQQIAVAERVLDGQGWGAWPACSAKLGLR